MENKQSSLITMYNYSIITCVNNKKHACGTENAVEVHDARIGVFDRIIGDGEKSLAKPSLLLHSCCGPCSTSVVERLAPDRRITIFFYNPNIASGDEYERRKNAQLDFIEQYNRYRSASDRLGFTEGAYESALFEEAARGLADEPEGGARCFVCFRLRLEKAAETAMLGGFDSFATTLTVSPHKDYETITRIGAELGLRYRVAYISEDFKKKDGYRRSVELSKKYGLYRQSSCGCRWGGNYSNPT
jgi:predicted adenine nucleotide alpha hydrolase (AANH) superfamily ATPase